MLESVEMDFSKHERELERAEKIGQLPTSKALLNKLYIWEMNCLLISQVMNENMNHIFIKSTNCNYCDPFAPRVKPKIL